jgi:hypothetical protein
MIKKIIVKIGRPKKLFTSKIKALSNIKKGQRVYKVKGGYKRTKITTYKISKIGVKKNTKTYIEQNKDFIKKLAKL